MAKAKTKIKHLSEWDWTTLVASWRYFERGHTAASAMFPADIIERFWQSEDYSDTTLDRIAHQFAEIDHGLRGEQDWAGMSDFDHKCDAIQWTKFFAFCRAWAKRDFKVVVLDGDFNGKHIHDEPVAFWCETTKRWYPKKEYILSPLREISCDDNFIREIKDIK